MAKSPKIRLRSDDRKEYERLARNAKAKIKRVQKNYGIDLADEIIVPSISSIGTRKELNKTMEKLSSFTNPHNQKFQYVKNKYNVVTTKSDIHHLEVANRRQRNRALKEQNKGKENPFISGGKTIGTVGERMVHIGESNVTGIRIPSKFDFDEVRSEQRLKDIRNSQEKRKDPEFYDKRKERMKDNFINILGLSFNSDADDLISRIKNIPAEDFFEMYKSFREFDFKLFDSEGQDVDASEGELNQMLSYVKDYEDGKLDFDLKNF